jgi:hypothetical protein
MAPMSDAFRSARALVDGYADVVDGVLGATGGTAARSRGARPPPAALKSAIRTVVKAYARATWDVRVPGTHPDGESFEDILGWLDASGREFLSQNQSLRRYVELELLLAFENGAAVPTKTQLQDAVQTAVRKRVADRMVRAIRDVPVKTLLAATVAKKRALGYVNPALPGYATGATHAAVAERLTVRVKL